MGICRKTIECPINPTTYVVAITVWGNRVPDITTIARLRTALADDFPGFDAVARRLREGGLLPAGSGGRDGVGSAQLDVRQTALLLIALAAPVGPIEAPAEAERIGAFRLLRRDDTHIGYEPKRTPFENQTITLLDVLAHEIERCDDDHLPSGWDIAAHGACQAAPDRLVFGRSLAELSDPADCVIRTTRIPGRLLADIAELFRLDRAEAA
jgi:hypothetical protein